MQEIRSISPDELPALLALYAHLHAVDAPMPDSTVVQSVWEEAMQNPRCRYFGAYPAGVLVASCTIMVIPNLTRACRPYAVIENVVTHAQHRKRGWGRAVLAHALTFAWEQNCYKAMLMTGRKDNATLQFYEGVGFDRHGKQAFVAKPP